MSFRLGVQTVISRLIGSFLPSRITAARTATLPPCECAITLRSLTGSLSNWSASVKAPRHQIRRSRPAKNVPANPQDHDGTS